MLITSQRLRCPNLKRLHLENSVFSVHECPFVDFPKSVKFVSLKGSEILHLPSKTSLARGTKNSPFLTIIKRLPNLTQIDLSDTESWLHRSDIEVCKEIKSLKKIILSEVEKYFFSFP